jgi:ribosome recycling factor
MTEMQTDPIAEMRDKMNKSIAVLKKDYATLRAGRANPQLLDRILVDYYGTPTPIAQMANISVPEPRMLVISLWDASLIKQVEKAIQSSNIGINPTNDGKVIRLIFPELTEERRKELSKVAHKMAEECKVAVRSIRREANEELQKEKKNNLLTEDDLKQMEKDVQKFTDDFIREIERILSDKEKEILSI